MRNRFIGTLAVGALAVALPVRAAEPACVAIVLPAATGVEGNATDVGAALRDLFTSYLNGPSLQVVPLDARLVSQAMEEARQKPCAYVLVASLNRKRGGGGLLGRALGHAASGAAWQMPVGRTAGAVVARGAAVGSAEALMVVSSSTKAKDELQLEYRVAATEGADRLAVRTSRAKARTDGEDLLTPMVQKASEEILAAVTSGAAGR